MGVVFGIVETLFAFQVTTPFPLPPSPLSLCIYVYCPSHEQPDILLLLPLSLLAGSLWSLQALDGRGERFLWIRPFAGPILQTSDRYQGTSPILTAQYPITDLGLTLSLTLT